MVKQYTKKPVQIDAVQFTLDNVDEVLDFIGNAAFFESDQSVIIIETLEGAMTAIPTDYIIKGVKGEFYPCKEDIFLATYDAV